MQQDIITDNTKFDNVIVPGGSMFVVSYTDCGYLRWITSIPGYWGNGLAMDNVNGNIYVTGADLINNTCFVKSYNASTGTIVATAPATLMTNTEIGTSITLDNTGLNVFVSFEKNSNTKYDIKSFDLSLSILTLSGISNVSGYCADIVADGLGRVYCTGTYSTALNLQQVFIRSYNLNTGFSINAINSIASSANGSAIGKSIIINSLGNICIAGYYESDIITFSGTTLSQWSGHDLFIAQADPLLNNFIWAKEGQSKDEDACYGITADNNGNVFVTGTFRNTIQIDGNAVTNLYNRSVFLTSISDAGIVNWLINAPTLNNGNGSVGTSVGIFDNYVYVLGYAQGQVRFGNTIFNSTNCDNTFVARFNADTQVFEKQQENNIFLIKEPEFSIIPNPNNGTFDIKFNHSFNSSAIIKIVNSLGQLVFEKVCNESINPVLVEARLPQGFYKVIFNSNIKYESQSLIIE